MEESETSFSIAQAAEAVGVSVPTLRSWERRYGWPRPARTRGGHRRYTRAQIEDLRAFAEAARSRRAGEILKRTRRA